MMEQKALKKMSRKELLQLLLLQSEEIDMRKNNIINLIITKELKGG